MSDQGAAYDKELMGYNKFIFGLIILKFLINWI